MGCEMDLRESQSKLGMRSFADLMVEALVAEGIDTCFTVAGGYTLPLLESLRKSSISVIAVHHEQSAAMAAQTFGQLRQSPALVLLTNGPAVTNSLTGLLASYLESTPALFISGEVMQKSRLDLSYPDLRQSGVQQVPTRALVETSVKSFQTCDSSTCPDEVVSDAIRLARTPRRGPVWIEVPLDVQRERRRDRSQFIDRPDQGLSTTGLTSEVSNWLEGRTIAGMSRPTIVIGAGLANSPSYDSACSTINQLNCPVVSTWGAKDKAYALTNFVGSAGVSGDRSANFALATCDSLLILGSRTTFTHVGYDLEAITDLPTLMVDVDRAEFEKLSLEDGCFVDLDFAAPGSAEVLDDLLRSFGSLFHQANCTTYLRNIRYIRESFPSLKEPFFRTDGKVSSFDVIDALNTLLDTEASVRNRSVSLVLDAGTAYRGTLPAIVPRPNLRISFAGGLASMGSGLPGLLGASRAIPTALFLGLFGDGGFMMNLQEMATVRQHLEHVIIMILNDGGYMAIANSQRAGNIPEFVSSDQNGLAPTDVADVCLAFGFKVTEVDSVDSFKNAFREALRGGLNLLDIRVPHEQSLMPRPGYRRGGRLGFADLTPYVGNEIFESWIRKVLSDQRIDGRH